jgi:hypothetical protein
MHPLITEDLARQHIADLQREGRGGRRPKNAPRRPRHLLQLIQVALRAGAPRS